MADRRAGRADMQPGIGLDGAIAGSDQTRTGAILRQGANGLAAGLAAPAKADPTEVSLWARGLGGPGRVGGRNGFDLTHVGVMVGADKRFDGALVGASFGYADGTTNGAGGLDRSGASAYQGSVYGSLGLDRIFVDAVAAYTYADTRTIRSLSFGDLSRTAVGSYGSDDLSAAFKIGTRAQIGALYAEPSLGLDWYRLSRDRFAERNAGSAGLDARAETQDIVQPSIGVRVTADIAHDGIVFSPEIRARYYHNVGDTASLVTASLVGAPGSPFTTTFAGIGRDTGVVSAGLTAQRDNLQVFTRYEAALGRDMTAHIVAGGLRYAW